MAYVVADLKKDDPEFNLTLNDNCSDMLPEVSPESGGDTIADVARIHWIGSDFGDPYDWNLFVLYDNGGKKLASKRVLGY